MPPRPTKNPKRTSWVRGTPAHRGFMNTNIVPDEILTTNDVAALLSVSPRTVEDWRLKGTGPDHSRRTGKQVWYFKSDVFRWLREG